MTRKRSTAIGVAVIVALVGIALGIYFGLFHKPSGELPSKMTIGYLPLTVNLPLFVASEKGYFQELEEEGVEVELVEFETSELLVEALVAGRITAIGNTGMSTLFAAEVASPGQIKMYLVTPSTVEKPVDYLVVKVDSPIASLADLKGKRLGAFPGATFLSYIRAFMGEFLDPEEDLTIIQLPPPLQLEALATGQVDALYTIEPFGTLAVEQGIARAIGVGLINKYVIDPYPGGAHCVSTRFDEEFPKVVDMLKVAMYRAVDFVRQDERAARLLLPKYTAVSEAVALDSGLGEYWKLTEVDTRNLQELADFFLREGILEKKVDAANMLLQ